MSPHRAVSGASGHDATPRTCSFYEIVLFCVILLGLVANVWPVVAQEETTLPLWYTVDAQGQLHIHTYVFWSRTCLHCERAIRFLHGLHSTHPWLRLHTYELSEQPANIERYRQMATHLGEKAAYVPAIFFCQQMIVGYTSDDTTGQQLRDELLKCYQRLQKPQPTAESASREAPRAEPPISPSPSSASSIRRRCPYPS